MSLQFKKEKKRNPTSVKYLKISQGFQGFNIDASPFSQSESWKQAADERQHICVVSKLRDRGARPQIEMSCLSAQTINIPFSWINNEI